MALPINYYNALLGVLFNNGASLPLRGGLNFVGFTVNSSQYGYDVIANPAGAASASNIGNDSSVAGTTVKDALNALNATGAANAAAIATNTSNITSNTSAISALQGRTLSAGANLTGGGDLSTNRSFALLADLTGMSSINGAKIAAPVQGAAISASATCVAASGSNYDFSATAAYNITLGTAGALTGEVLSFRASATLGATVGFVNGGASGGTLGSYNGIKPILDFRYDGTNWSGPSLKRGA